MDPLDPEVRDPEGLALALKAWGNRIATTRAEHFIDRHLRASALPEVEPPVGPRRSNATPADVIAKALEMRAGGASIRATAKALGVCTETVAKWERRAGRR